MSTESTFAPLVVLVINDYTLCGWTNVFPSSIFQEKLNHGTGDGELESSKCYGHALAKAQDSTFLVE